MESGIMKFGDKIADGLVATNKSGGQLIKLGFTYTATCIRDGKEIWQDTFPNIMVTEGLTEVLENFFRTSVTPGFYIFLIDSTTGPAPGDTMASHSGWTEVTSYDEAVRQTLTFSAASALSIAGVQDTFTISATVDVDGVAVVGSTGASSTKSDSNGTLISAANFTGGTRSLIDNDVLNIDYSVTAADA